MSPEFETLIDKPETRIKKKFLLLPHKIGNVRKWLCVAYIVQAHKIFGYDGDLWFDVCFVGEATYKYYKDTGHVLVTRKKIDEAWENYWK